MDQPEDTAQDQPQEQPDYNALYSQEQSACQHQFRIATPHGTLAGQDHQQEQGDGRCRCANEVGEQGAVSGADIIDRGSNAQQPNESQHVQIDELGVQIHEKDDHQRRTEQADQPGIQRTVKDAEVCVDQHVQHGVQTLHQRIAERDLCAAAVAFSPEPAPAENRDQIPFPDGRAAGHAVGIVPPQGFLLGQPVDTDVQKAADGCTKGKDDAVQQRIA